MKYATVPVVAAPYGMTLGGGLELASAATRAGGGRDLLGPRRGRRRPHPRRRRRMNMLWRALEGMPEGVDVEHLRVRHAGVQEHRAREGRDARRGGARRSATSAQTDGVSFDRARQLTRPSSARSGSPRRLPPAGAARVQAARRERHRDAADDGRHAGRRRIRAASTTRRSRMKLADVLCGGVGGARARSPRTRCSSSSARRSSACAASR